MPYKYVSVTEAKMHLSRWVKLVETTGRIVVITRRGVPVAALYPLTGPNRYRPKRKGKKP